MFLNRSNLSDENSKLLDKVEYLNLRVSTLESKVNRYAVDYIEIILNDISGNLFTINCDLIGVKKLDKIKSKIKNNSSFSFEQKETLILLLNKKTENIKSNLYRDFEYWKNRLRVICEDTIYDSNLASEVFNYACNVKSKESLFEETIERFDLITSGDLNYATEIKKIEEELLEEL